MFIQIYNSIKTEVKTDFIHMYQNLGVHYITITTLNTLLPYIEVRQCSITVTVKNIK